MAVNRPLDDQPHLKTRSTGSLGRPTPADHDFGRLAPVRRDPHRPLRVAVREALGGPDRTLKQRAADVLAYFDRPGTSNGPTEAINGRLEHLRGSALGFRNLTNYIARCLLETGGFRPRLHRGLGWGLSE